MSSKKSLESRMYEQEYPEVNDLVVVQVKSIAEHGAYCSLLEFNKIEGMILMSELSRRRIRSVNRFIRVGKQEIVSVLRVNKQKGYIDLSKKRVSHDEIQMVEDRWNRSKAVHSIMRHVAKKANLGVQSLYELFGWPLARKYRDAYEGLKRAAEHRAEFLAEFDIPQGIQACLFEIIEKRMKPQVVKIEAGIEVTCFTKEGILAIKRALKKGLDDHSTDESVIHVKLERPPQYVVYLFSLDPDQGKAKVREVIRTIADEMKRSGGNLAVKKEPTVIAHGGDGRMTRRSAESGESGAETRTGKGRSRYANGHGSSVTKSSFE